MEALLKEYMQKNDALLETNASSIRNLELQMGQIVGELKNRQKGYFPNNTEALENMGNLGKKQCQAMMLHSGKLIIELLRPRKKTPLTQTTNISNDQLHSQPTTDSPTDFTEEHANTTLQKQVDAQKTQSEKSASISTSTKLQTPHYPQRLRKKKNDEWQFRRFLDMLK